ncbi:hypothetical protein OAB57_02005 [Bacteriovoracaceae bacterium]|nr:hypothetical protein [Bacteriovoracaceae bacterium]
MIMNIRNSHDDEKVKDRRIAKIFSEFEKRYFKGEAESEEDGVLFENLKDYPTYHYRHLCNPHYDDYFKEIAAIESEAKKIKEGLDRSVSNDVQIKNMFQKIVKITKSNVFRGAVALQVNKDLSKIVPTLLPFTDVVTELLKSYNGKDQLRLDLIHSRKSKPYIRRMKFKKPSATSSSNENYLATLFASNDNKKSFSERSVVTKVFNPEVEGKGTSYMVSESDHFEVMTPPTETSESVRKALEVVYRKKKTVEEKYIEGMANDTLKRTTYIFQSSKNPSSLLKSPSSSKQIHLQRKDQTKSDDVQVTTSYVTNLSHSSKIGKGVELGDPIYTNNLPWEEDLLKDNPDVLKKLKKHDRETKRLKFELTRTGKMKKGGSIELMKIVALKQMLVDSVLYGSKIEDVTVDLHATKKKVADHYATFGFRKIYSDGMISPDIDKSWSTVWAFGRIAKENAIQKTSKWLKNGREFATKKMTSIAPKIIGDNSKEVKKTMEVDVMPEAQNKKQEDPGFAHTVFRGSLSDMVWYYGIKKKIQEDHKDLIEKIPELENVNLLIEYLKITRNMKQFTLDIAKEEKTKDLDRTKVNILNDGGLNLLELKHFFDNNNIKNKGEHLAAHNSDNRVIEIDLNTLFDSKYNTVAGPIRHETIAGLCGYYRQRLEKLGLEENKIDVWFEKRGFRFVDGNENNDNSTSNVVQVDLDHNKERSDQYGSNASSCNLKRKRTGDHRKIYEGSAYFTKLRSTF